MGEYGGKFERVVNKFFGQPKTTANYHSFYIDDFSRRALLYSICVKEINSNPENYSEDQLEKLKEFEFQLCEGESTQHQNVECIDFLSEL
ncbi:MAG: hypothetical protein WD334_10965 [Chitinophagales bacterium]